MQGVKESEADIDIFDKVGCVWEELKRELRSVRGTLFRCLDGRMLVEQSLDRNTEGHIGNIQERKAAPEESVNGGERVAERRGVLTGG